MNDKYRTILPKAIHWSSGLFVRTFDRNDQPYMLHNLYVMNGVAHIGFYHMILGVCHDGPEDCFDTIEEGIKSFQENVTEDEALVADLRLLSHRPEDSYPKYIRGIKTSQRATDVKKVDLTHNSMITRIKGLGDKDIARIRKYHASYCFLSGDDSKLLDLVN